MTVRKTITKVKATHVIIGGVVFPWAAKAPYVAAGKSILGGLEYNDEHDLIKCHVCGGWFVSVGKHLETDGINAAAYKRDFGLLKKTGLCTPSHSIQSARIGKRSGNVARLRNGKRPGRKAGNVSFGCAEERNLQNLCQAQIRHRVMELAIRLNGTPTQRDLTSVGIRQASIERAFAMNTTAFMRSLGLTPNRSGQCKQGIIRQPLPPQNQMLRVAEAGLFSPA
jgi:hypothetical protein